MGGVNEGEPRGVGGGGGGGRGDEEERVESEAEWKPRPANSRGTNQGCGSWGQSENRKSDVFHLCHFEDHSLVLKEGAHQQKKKILNLPQGNY